MDPVGEILLVRVAGQVCERQHSDGLDPRTIGPVWAPTPDTTHIQPDHGSERDGHGNRDAGQHPSTEQPVFPGRERRRDGTRLNGLKRGTNLVRLPITGGWLLRQTPLDDRPEFEGDFRRQWWRRLAEDCRTHLEPGLPLEGAHACRQLIEHDPECPYIAARCRGVAAQSLRRHVRQGAHDGARFGHRGLDPGRRLAQVLVTQALG